MPCFYIGVLSQAPSIELQSLFWATTSPQGGDILQLRRSTFVVFDPPWDQSMMSEAARLEAGLP